MPTPHTSTNFGDVLDPRFRRIFTERFNDLPDMLPTLFEMAENNGRDTVRDSEVGELGNWPQFTGSVEYDSQAQGYDVTATPVEFASGIQIERKLFDDDQYNVMDRRPASLATAAQRTRQVHGARIFNNAFSVDTFFYNHSEGVALCSDSHTTEADSVSTASGFDNLTTNALSATAVIAARKQFVDFRDDRANRIMLSPDEILIHPDSFDVAYEIVASMGKVDTAENNANVLEGAFRVIEWNYLTDTNNWFMMDSGMRRQMLYWMDRVAIEFAFAEDIDTLVAKWRGYMRYVNWWNNWRFILGAQVS